MINMMEFLNAARPLQDRSLIAKPLFISHGALCTEHFQQFEIRK
jgi:hypothetical protein